MAVFFLTAFGFKKANLSFPFHSLITNICICMETFISRCGTKSLKGHIPNSYGILSGLWGWQVISSVSTLYISWFEFFFTVRYVNEYLINLNRRNPFKTDYTLYLWIAQLCLQRTVPSLHPPLLLNEDLLPPRTSCSEALGSFLRMILSFWWPDWELI